MTAKEYLRTHQKAMYCFDEISSIIHDLYPLRHDKEMTKNYYERILQSDIRHTEKMKENEKWSDGLAEYGQIWLPREDGEFEYYDAEFRYNNGEFSIDETENIREKLLKVIQEDKSFGHLFNLLSKDKDNFISQQEIEKAIREEDKEERIDELKSKTFSAYLIPDNEKLKNKIIEKLKEILRGKKGKNVAIVLRAMKESDVIAYSEGERKALYESMRDIFGEIGTDTSINNYLTEQGLSKGKENEYITCKLTYSDIVPFVKQIKEIMVV